MRRELARETPTAMGCAAGVLADDAASCGASSPDDTADDDENDWNDGCVDIRGAPCGAFPACGSPTAGPPPAAAADADEPAEPAAGMPPYAARPPKPCARTRFSCSAAPPTGAAPWWPTPAAAAGAAAAAAAAACCCWTTRSTRSRREEPRFTRSLCVCWLSERAKRELLPAGMSTVVTVSKVCADDLDTDEPDCTRRRPSRGESLSSVPVPGCEEAAAEEAAAAAAAAAPEQTRISSSMVAFWEKTRRIVGTSSASVDEGGSSDVGGQGSFEEFSSFLVQNSDVIVLLYEMGGAQFDDVASILQSPYRQEMLECAMSPLAGPDSPTRQRDFATSSGGALSPPHSFSRADTLQRLRAPNHPSGSDDESVASTAGRLTEMLSRLDQSSDRNTTTVRTLLQNIKVKKSGSTYTGKQRGAAAATASGAVGASGGSDAAALAQAQSMTGGLTSLLHQAQQSPAFASAESPSLLSMASFDTGRAPRVARVEMGTNTDFDLELLTIVRGGQARVRELERDGDDTDGDDATSESCRMPRWATALLTEVREAKRHRQQAAAAAAAQAQQTPAKVLTQQEQQRQFDEITQRKGSGKESSNGGSGKEKSEASKKRDEERRRRALEELGRRSAGSGVTNSSSCTWSVEDYSASFGSNTAAAATTSSSREQKQQQPAPKKAEGEDDVDLSELTCNIRNVLDQFH
eukprot:Rhum_TRINITY_DN15354_c6_g1::Rhum_TRINITY_DN15354_c6_g1_i1::g.154028::m.154028